MTNLIRRITPRALRNWVRQPGRSARYVFDRMAYACGGAREIQIFDNWSPRCHPASRSHFTVFAEDKAQQAELDSFVKLCSPGMQFLDIGAHYGLFALAAVRFGGMGARVVCVEASRKAAAILEANIRANQAVPQVQILNVAMGGTDGTLEMLSTGPAGSDYFVSAPAGRTDTVSVPQLSMPSLLRESALKPTHVKIDIEGFEDDVIAAAIETLSSLRPVIFLELHGGYLRARERDPAAVIRDLRRAGYNRFEENGRALEDPDIAAGGYEHRLICLPG
jgi:FkbM family methyltransferase